MKRKLFKYWCSNLCFALSHPREIRLIKPNEKYKGIYIGKRCFIFGNGPSIEELDFSMFSNETVFTVNQIMRKPGFELLKTNYHFIADQNYFKIDPIKSEDAELLKTLRSITTTDNRPICFFPSNQLDFVRKFDLEKDMTVSYFCSPINLLENNILSIDFTWLIPRFGTVVHFAIAMAIYMGFKEIYLLGCEGTSIVANIQSALKRSSINNSYCYEVNDLQRRWLEKVVSNKSMEKCAKSFYDMLVGYRMLSEYCQANGTKIYNCTPESVIDSIQFIDIQKVIGKQK